ncbi:uncharacterized protein [Fopius arisanus]|uniref:TIL domain-containing protein n=1 Tax=Fopius arisanus TaxID=64838 RepID=A0A9R1TC56_9HYME|nr:PREDICTED: uncharacterized protein LOC105268650 [Fopius arisanus]
MDKTALIVLIIVTSSAINSQYTDDSDYDDFPISEDRISEARGPDDFYIVSEDEVRELERKYQYTKHRIPGYDYDELDFVEEGKRCDDRSLWTHCLCQFTCTSKNTVDCYTPCRSGCECREDFVLDEESGTCVYPDQCVDSIRI